MDRVTITRIARRLLSLALISATVIGLSAMPAQSVTKKAKKPKVITTKAAKKPAAIPTTAAVTTVAVTTVAVTTVESTAAALTTFASTTAPTAPSSSTASVPTPATPTSAAGPAAVAGAINIVGFSFGDRSISVKVGPVSITNQDGDAHTVTADDGSFSESVGPKQTATLTVAKPGTFKFHCNIHPAMTGTLVVT